MPYEPSDYETLLIAAGWVTLAELDDEYLAHCRRYEPIDYELWVTLTSDLARLNEEYRARFGDTYPEASTSTPAWVRQADFLIRDIGDIEALLGY